MKNVEEGVMVEFMLLEGADQSGLTKPPKPYRWFGKQVYAYPPNDIDDVLYGTDAILMFPEPDPEKEDRSFAIAVDMKTRSDDFAEKVTNEMSWAMRRAVGTSRVYWADTTADPEEPTIEDPKPGKVDVVKLAAYIPSEFATEFRAETTTPQRRNEIMNKLAPLLRKQFQAQLELLALMLLQKLHLEDAVSGRVSVDRTATREELVRLFAHPPQLSAAQQKTFEIISKVLPTIWKTQEECRDGENIEGLPALIERMGSTAAAA